MGPKSDPRWRCDHWPVNSNDNCRQSCRKSDILWPDCPITGGKCCQLLCWLDLREPGVPQAAPTILRCLHRPQLSPAACSSEVVGLANVFSPFDFMHSHDACEDEVCEL